MAPGKLYVVRHALQAPEGAGAAALAGLLRERDRWADRRVAVVLSGGNVDRQLFARTLAESD